MPTAPHPIRSYVLRQGNYSPAQKRAREAGWVRWGVPFQSTPLDLDALFGRSARRVLEIGFGMGLTLAEKAAQQAEVDFLGLEVHGPGVGNLMKLLAAQHLSNIRVIQHDAHAALAAMIAPESFDEIYILFPDPWPKKRHQKRRLIQPPFVMLLAERLRPGGQLYLATDWKDYAEQMLAVLSAQPLLRNTMLPTLGEGSGGFAPRQTRTVTRFEARGIARGYAVWDLVFQRIAR